MTSPEPSEGINLVDVGVPQYVQGLVALDRLGMTLEDTEVTVIGRAGTRHAHRIPLIDVTYPDQGAADAAILSAMGYEASELPPISE